MRKSLALNAVEYASLPDCGWDRIRKSRHQSASPRSQASAVVNASPYFKPKPVLNSINAGARVVEHKMCAFVSRHGEDATIELRIDARKVDFRQQKLDAASGSCASPRVLCISDHRKQGPPVFPGHHGFIKVEGTEQGTLMQCCHFTMLSALLQRFIEARMLA